MLERLKTHARLRRPTGRLPPKGLESASKQRSSPSTPRPPGQVLKPERLLVVDLGPLDASAGVHLAQGVNSSLTAEAARELWKRSAGSPFWLQVLAESGGADLSELMASRWALLGRDAVRLLALLALAARPVPVAELSAIEGWSPARVQRALAELESIGTVVASAGEVRVAHDLLRTAAEARIPGTTRLDVHRRLARWLERAAGDVDVQLMREALFHGRQAELDGLELSLRMVRSPRRRLLTAEALRELAQAADAVGFVGSAAELQEKIAALMSEGGELESALNRWLLVAERHPESSVRARALFEASRAAYRLPGRRAQALPLLAAARQADPHIAILTVEMAAHEANLLRLLEHRMEDARAIALHAVSLARSMATEAGGIPAMQPAARDAYVKALQAAFDAAYIDEDYATMAQISQEMVEVARYSEESMVLSALNLGSTAFDLGRITEAVEYASRAWQQARERILPLHATAAGADLARFLEYQGRLADAEDVTLKCMELEARVRGRHERLTFPRIGMVSFHVTHHRIKLSRGEWRAAISALQREVEMQPDPHHRIPPRGTIATWLARIRGQEAESNVGMVLSAAHADAGQAGCRRCGRRLLLYSAEASARVGRLEQAEEMLAEWRPEKDATPQDRMWHRHVLALIGFSRGDVRVAIASLEEAQQERARLGCGHDLVWGHLDLGAGLARSQPTRAAEEFRVAGAQAESIGASTEAALADLGLRRLGVHTWRRGPASRRAEALRRLSEREREIARMVAAGASNPDVASALFLSRKTVERHVSNVLAKTGVRNRTELAGLLADESGGPSSARRT